MSSTKPPVIYLKDYQVPDFLIDQVDLECLLDEEFTLITSLLQIRRNPESAAHSANLLLVGDGLELTAIKLNDTPLAKDQYRATSDALEIFSLPSACQLTIQTKMKPQENTALSGLYKSSGNFCTQCEAEGFRRITYFLDRPDIMARYTTTIIADEKKYPILLSNGNPVASGKRPDGKHWVSWQDPFKKPSYLFALVAGDLEYAEDFFITASGRRITLRIYVEKGNLDKCEHAMQGVKKAMRWDEEKYGREYDLDIYMIVAVSDFNMGAMENKGLNIFNTKYILARPETATDLDFIHVESVIAHEYFHNWTGNRITCRDWFQLSLKEGLTIFRDQHFTADTTSKTVARIHDVDALRNSQFPEDSGPLAHPVRPDSYIEINNFYTATIYNKGSEVIKMIKTCLGDELFRQGMDLYFARFDGQAITIEDFVKAHEDASQIDLSQMRLWYSQAGTPVLDVTDYYDADKKTYTLKIKQSCPPTPDQPHKLPMHIPVKMGLLNPAGQEVLSDLLHVKEREQEFHFSGIDEKPIPSLLRHFSAPVKLKFNYSDADLTLLFKHDTDLFNRWEAGQTLAIHLILRIVEEIQQNKPLSDTSEFSKALQHALQTMQHDKWLLAEMLQLPSEKYLAEQMTVVDVDAIHAARDYLQKAIALQLKDTLLHCYQQCQNKTFEFTMEEVGKRFLKNACLMYLMTLNEPSIQAELGLRQLRETITLNMTDAIAALRALANTEGAVRQTALDEFYQTWQGNSLVLDKWFAIQAMAALPDTLARIKELMKHPAFDIKNPNKVYALIGAFGANPSQFHLKTGAGYAFLAQVVLQLDALNPQVAARMIQPLTHWKRYDTARQVLMREQLNVIAKHASLSSDVFEIVSKSL